MLLQSQNAVLVVKKLPQNFYQCMYRMIHQLCDKDNVRNHWNQPYYNYLLEKSCNFQIYVPYEPNNMGLNIYKNGVYDRNLSWEFSIKKINAHIQSFR